MQGSGVEMVPRANLQGLEGYVGWGDKLFTAGGLAKLEQKKS